MTRQSAASLLGECLCGTIRFSVADGFEYAFNCHCRDCRRTTGSAFKALAGIKADKLVVIAGQNHILRYGNDSDFNAHCGLCGSFLFSSVRDGTYVHVGMGSLTDIPSIKPSRHIFVGSKATWLEIADTLPQFHEHAP